MRDRGAVKNPFHDILACFSTKSLSKMYSAHSPIFSLLFYRTSVQSIQRKSDITEHDVSKRCKDLASFMENLLQETRAPGLGKDVLAADDRSFSVTISYVLVSPTLIYLGSSTLWCAVNGLLQAHTCSSTYFPRYA